MTSTEQLREACAGVKGALVDIDGVFVQTKQSSRGIFVQMVREHLDCPYTRQFSDKNLRDFFHAYASQGRVAYPLFLQQMREGGEDVLRLPPASWFAEEHERAYLEAISKKGVVEPIHDGLRLVLTLFAWNRHNVAAVTGGTKAQLAIKSKFIPELGGFEAIVTTDDVPEGRGKPCPDGFEIGAEKLGLDPAECLFVEDSTAGILSGKEAGCSVGLVRPQPGSKTLAHLREEPGLLDDTDCTKIIAVEDYDDPRIGAVLRRCRTETRSRIRYTTPWPIMPAPEAAKCNETVA